MVNDNPRRVTVDTSVADHITDLEDGFRVIYREKLRHEDRIDHLSTKLSEKDAEIKKLRQYLAGVSNAAADGAEPFVSSILSSSIDVMGKRYPAHPTVVAEVHELRRISYRLIEQLQDVTTLSEKIANNRNALLIEIQSLAVAGDPVMVNKLLRNKIFPPEDAGEPLDEEAPGA